MALLVDPVWPWEHCPWQDHNLNTKTSFFLLGLCILLWLSIFRLAWLCFCDSVKARYASTVWCPFPFRFAFRFWPWPASKTIAYCEAVLTQLSICGIHGIHCWLLLRISQELVMFVAMARTSDQTVSRAEVHGFNNCWVNLQVFVQTSPWLGCWMPCILWLHCATCQ